MKQQYLKDDRLRRSRDIDLGDLMLYDEIEWRKRTVAARDMFMENNLKSFAIVILPVLAFVVLMTIVFDWLERDGFWTFIILILILTGIPNLPSAYIIHRNGKAKPVAGLYTNGILLFNRLFVPYGEVDRIEEGPVGNRVFGKMILVFLIPKGKRRFSRLHTLL
ncbi:MAG: hypothetical protein JSW25_02720, partial [Thermoplasmata archaeon]